MLWTLNTEIGIKLNEAWKGERYCVVFLFLIITYGMSDFSSGKKQSLYEINLCATWNNLFLFTRTFSSFDQLTANEYEFN